jgi:hypothetical protein
MEEGQLRHLIGGDEVEEPEGWRDFREDIERDYQRRMISNKFPLELTFVGGGYAKLRAAYIEAYCTTFTYACEQFYHGNWTNVCTGVLIVADVEFNLTRGTARVPIADDGVGARVNNNRDIEIFPTAVRTKNQDTISAVTELPLEVFDQFDAYLPATRRAYDWYACMQHCILSITDNQASLVSDWYEALPDAERYAVLTGFELRQPSVNGRSPAYNIDDLFNSLARPYNLWISVERSVDNEPVLRMEPEDYFFGSGVSMAFPFTDNLVQSINRDLLYQLVRVGSKNAIKNERDEPQYSLPFVGLRTFYKEEFHMEGECNTEKTLDLSTPFNIDDNSIYDAINNGSDKNDDEVFLIQYDKGTNQAVQGNYMGNPPFHYNEELLNLSVLQRYNLAAAGISNYGPTDNDFVAFKSIAQAFTVPIGGTSLAQLGFDQIISDVGGNYGNGTPTPVSIANSRYTAPVQGYYIFDTILNQNITSLTFSGGGTAVLSFTRRAIHRDSGGVQIGFNDFEGTLTLGENLQEYTFTPSFAFDMNAGDYAEVWIGYHWTLDGFFLSATAEVEVYDSVYQTSYNVTAGGEIPPFDADAYHNTKYEFQRHTPLTDWLQLKSDFGQQVLVSENDSMRIGYVRKVSRLVHNGETKWELVANRKQPNV